MSTASHDEVLITGTNARLLQPYKDAMSTRFPELNVTIATRDIQRQHAIRRGTQPSIILTTGLCCHVQRSGDEPTPDEVLMTFAHENGIPVISLCDDEGQLIPVSDMLGELERQVSLVSA